MWLATVRMYPSGETSTPVPYDDSPWKPPAPYSLTSFLFTWAATLANESSARAGPPTKTRAATRAVTRRPARTICIVAPSSTHGSVAGGFLTPPTVHRPLLLQGRQLVVLDGIDAELPVAVPNLDPVRQHAPLHSLVI